MCCDFGSDMYLIDIIGWFCLAVGYCMDGII